MSETQETEKLVDATDERVRPQAAEQDSQTDEKVGEPKIAHPASADASAKKWIGLAIAAVAVIVIAVVVFFAFGGAGSTADNAANDGANASTTSANANANAYTNANQAAASSGSSRLTKDADSSNTASSANGAASSDATNGEGVTYTYVTTTAEGGESAQGASGYSSEGASEGWGESDAARTDADEGFLHVYVTVDCSRAPGYGDVMFDDWIELREGATAYDALSATGLFIGARVSGYGIYIDSIDGLAEKFPGYEGSSGWIYMVNGVIPGVSCGEYTLSENDTLVWAYTLDMGNDL